MKLEEAIKTSRFADARHRATLNILFSAYWLRNKLAGAIKEENITLEQFNVLRILKGAHPAQMCVKDIGTRMIEKSSNVPRIIDRLVEKKLARRTTSKVDKRETLISLTEKGIELLTRASAAIDEATATISTLNENEWNQLHELLEKMKA
jgi:DNA-binding MarR family transcriptional regulator